MNSIRKAIDPRSSSFADRKRNTMKRTKIKLALGRETFRLLNIVEDLSLVSYRPTQTGATCSLWNTCTNCR